MSVVGTWKLVVRGPTGAVSSVLEFTESDGVLGGSQTGQGNTTEITLAKVEGNSVYWESTTLKPFKLKLEFTGTLEGDQITGKVKTGPMGSHPFTATKQ
jgi:hypothetical protein